MPAVEAGPAPSPDVLPQAASASTKPSEYGERDMAAFLSQDDASRHSTPRVSPFGAPWLPPRPAFIEVVVETHSGDARRKFPPSAGSAPAPPVLS
ncbi:MAG: hypothetical protein AMXMBFR56_48100 [Polyangiaceae bacterium]